MEKQASVKPQQRRSLLGKITRRFSSSSSSTAAARREEQAEKTLQTEPSKQEIPSSVWIANIFPLLNRFEQNQLAAAHREVFLARRLHNSNSNTNTNNNMIMTWPAGRIQQVVGGKRGKQRQHRQRPVMAVAFSRDDHTLVVALAGSKKVHVYDKLKGLLQQKLIGHTGPVVDVKYSPDGNNSNTLATASSNDGTIRLWNTNNNSLRQLECFRVLHIYQSNLCHIVWSPTGEWIASWGNQGMVRVSNVADGSLRSTYCKTRLEVGACHETVAFAPPLLHHNNNNDNGSNDNIAVCSLALAYNNEVVRLWSGWSSAEAEHVSIRTLPHSQDVNGSYAGNYVTALAYSPNHQYLVMGCPVATIKFWSITNNDDNDNTADQNYCYDYDRSVHLGTHWSAVTLIQFTPDSQYIACTGNGSQIRLLNVSTGTVVANLNGHVGRVNSLCFSSNGTTLASGGCDRSIRLWSMLEYY